LQDLRREVKMACAAVPLATMRNVWQSVARRCQQCIAAGGWLLNICDFKYKNITILSLLICELWTFKLWKCFFWGTHYIETCFKPGGGGDWYLKA
jgi:hypothetical protein